MPKKKTDKPKEEKKVNFKDPGAYYRRAEDQGKKKG